jgi:alginate O-acetyltransferase complex protein AlgI
MLILSPSWMGVMLITVAIHWLLADHLRGWWLILVTACYVGFYSPDSLVLLSIFTVVLYYGAGKVGHLSGRRLVLLIAFNAAVLCVYKALAALSVQPDSSGGGVSTFIIPLGLSYYAFRSIHFAIERYKGSIASVEFYGMIQYLFFLPTLVAGPIHRFPEFSRDLQRKRWDGFMFAEGIERILYGYAKIVFLSHLLVSYYLELYIRDTVPVNPSLAAYMDMLQGGLNGYFLFAGYTDIAIGFGLLMGYRVMENFNWPLLRENIAVFWRNWHASLSSWCRDYVYMGVIATTRSPALGALASMIVMGLWHEFSIRYVLWGVYHGLGIAIWQQFQRLKAYFPSIGNRAVRWAWQLFSILLTLHFVMVGFLLVRHDTLSGFLDQLKQIIWLMQ